MGDEITDLDKRVTRLETSMPLMISNLDKGLDELKTEVHKGFSELKKHLTSFAVHESTIKKLQDDINIVSIATTANQEENEKFHKSVQAWLTTLKVIGVIGGIVWGVAQFAIPYFIK